MTNDDTLARSNLRRGYSRNEAELIREWWAGGYSAAQIARMLGTGRSRNSIIGFVHRHINGYEKAKNPRKQYVKVARLRARPTTPAPQKAAGAFRDALPIHGPRAVLFAPVPLRMPLEDLAFSNCRYACNDPAKGEEFLFCGHQIKPESRYCAYHHDLCHMAFSPKKHDLREFARL